MKIRKGLSAQKLIILLVIIILFVGAGIYFYSNYQNKSVQTNKSGAFSTEIDNYPQAKSSEVVSLKNGDTYNLTASFVKQNIDGNEVKMLAYNGMIPGPTIKVAKGSEVTINFTNNTDVDSTIHSHGVRVDNKFDGVVDISQKPVKPGESFTYKLKFPDEGIFWYHPHIREDYAQELGLYGAYLVTPTQKDYWGEVDREEMLFLDDILMDNGKIASFDKNIVTNTLMGRFGNVMLINGQDKFNLSVKQGQRIRFYLTNAANTRVFNVLIPNARIKLVGGDNGKYEREEWVDSLVLSPSERAVIEVIFEEDGEYQIVHKTPDKTYSMGKITVNKAPVTTKYFPVLRSNQEFIDSLNPLRPLFVKVPDKKLNITLDMMGMNQNMEGMDHSSMMMGGNETMESNQAQEENKIEWEDNMQMMNSMSTNKNIKWKLVDDITKKENMDINWQFKKGDKIKFSFFNDPKSEHPMQHPIHIHGQKFLVLTTNGIPNENLVWKDTVLVQKGDTVDVLVNMENPGDWLIHCHIPEHMEAGMMTKFGVL
jgi:suppressor of ftsI